MLYVHVRHFFLAVDVFFWCDFRTFLVKSVHPYLVDYLITCYCWGVVLLMLLCFCVFKFQVLLQVLVLLNLFYLLISVSLN